MTSDARYVFRFEIYGSNDICYFTLNIAIILYEPEKGWHPWWESNPRPSVQPQCPIGGARNRPLYSGSAFRSTTILLLIAWQSFTLTCEACEPTQRAAARCARSHAIFNLVRRSSESPRWEDRKEGRGGRGVSEGGRHVLRGTIM